MTIDPLQLGIPMMDTTHSQNAADDLRRMDLQKAAEQFEGYMTQVLIREMRKTVPEGLFTSSAMDVFSGVLDEELSARISGSGQLGLAQELMQGLGEGGSNEVGDLQPSLMLGETGALQSRGFAAYAKASSENNGRKQGYLPVHGRLSSRFGWRNSPIDGHRSHHNGMDIAASRGSRIDAVRAGTVTFSGESRGYGNLVVIDHGDGLTSRYAHCDDLKVSKGDRVRGGEAIATVGSTGRSTGPHLHFELQQNGEVIDPQVYFGWDK